MGRTSDARERLLNAGTRLLSGRSYGSIGVAEIASTADVPKGSFYYFFPSKQEFALAVINDHWLAQQAEWERVLFSEGSFSSRTKALFDLTQATQVEAQNGTGSVAGCMFGNLALEVAASEPAISARLSEIFDSQVQLLSAAAGQAMQHTPGPRSARQAYDTDAIATAIVANLEGAVLLARLRNDPAQIEKHWPFVQQFLGDWLNNGVGGSGLIREEMAVADTTELLNEAMIGPVTGEIIDQKDLAERLLAQAKEQGVSPTGPERALPRDLTLRG